MDTGKQTVLLVEDDTLLRKLFAMIINNDEEYIAKVYEDDLRKVIEKVNWNDIQIVVSDQMLGSRIYGSHILEHVEKTYPHIWRVMITGDSLINPAKTHCDRLIFKPAFPEELVASLRSDRG